MHSIKPGRGPSAMGAVGGVVAVIFGIFWTILAFKITRGSPLPVMGLVFPLFGLLFIGLGLSQVWFNLRNATARDRFSVYDVTSEREEPDPLVRLLGPRKSGVPDGSPESKLKKLAEMHRDGLISDAELAAQRERILNGI